MIIETAGWARLTFNSFLHREKEEIGQKNLGKNLAQALGDRLPLEERSFLSLIKAIPLKTR